MRIKLTKEQIRGTSLKEGTLIDVDLPKKSLKENYISKSYGSEATMEDSFGYGIFKKLKSSNWTISFDMKDKNFVNPYFSRRKGDKTVLLQLHPSNDNNVLNILHPKTKETLQSFDFLPRASTDIASYIDNLYDNLRG